MKKDIHSIVRICVSGIWLVLLIFAIIWYIEPQWLQDISSHGKFAEASENKQKGDELLRQKEFALALEAYSDAVSILPEMQSAQIGKAIALFHLGNPAAALDIYKTLLSQEPDKPWEIYYNLAMIYESQRNLEKTVEVLEKEAEVTPNPFDSNVRLARLYFTSGNWQEALKNYRKAFDHKPDMENDLLSTLRAERATYHQDSLLVKSIDEYLTMDYQTELEDKYYREPYDEELERNPVVAMIYNDAGFCYAMLGDIPSSLPFFQTAVKMQPQNEEYRQNLAKAQSELKGIN
jgi:tetratricopeptide (TPR) repeat protein